MEDPFEDGLDDLFASIDTSKEEGNADFTDLVQGGSSQNEQINPNNVVSSDATLKNPFASREAFFANWESSELSSREKRIKAVRREFPGPAGLRFPLTEYPTSSSSNSDILLDSSTIPRTENKLLPKPEEFSPERRILLLNKAPWQSLVKQLKLQPDNPNDPINLMNIIWVRKFMRRFPVEVKLPFLAVVLYEKPSWQYSEARKKTTSNPMLRLMDASGEIEATVESKFFEEQKDCFIPGAAIAVKNVSVLRLRNNKTVILTLTRANFIFMSYVPQKDVDGVEMNSAAGSEETPDVAQIKIFQDFDVTDILQKYEDVKNFRNL